jgi:hypothetical protein
MRDTKQTGFERGLFLSKGQYWTIIHPPKCRVKVSVPVDWYGKFSHYYMGKANGYLLELNPLPFKFQKRVEAKVFLSHAPEVTVTVL